MEEEEEMESSAAFMGMMKMLNMLGGEDVLKEAMEAALESAPKYDTDDETNCEIKVKDVLFVKKYVKGGVLRIKSENAEILLNKNPNIFQDLEIEIIDTEDDDYFEES